ncbi:MAG: carboxypeptidase-like regulatory domain-containing protein [Vulcanimicrobiaceae bacterium]
MTALAGTTGNITGTATDYSTGAPLAGVKVSATSLSQSATTTTDAHGFYSLLNLARTRTRFPFKRTAISPSRFRASQSFRIKRITSTNVCKGR